MNFNGVLSGIKQKCLLVLSAARHRDLEPILVTEMKNNKSCKPFRHIFYLKVPKTGSSTFSSILNRMIFKHNLTTFWLRKNLPHPNTLLVNLGQAKPNRALESRFDMQVNHGIFNKETIEKAMQKDTVYVATLRHPFQHMVSKFFYRYRKLDLPLVEVEFDRIRRSRVIHKGTNVSLVKDRKYKFLENPMFKYFEFNYTKALFNGSYFSECITYVSSLFLVVITDRYDESLLMLRHKFCWDIKEIIYIPHKNASFSYKYKQQPEYRTLYQKHQSISSLDYRLYAHFLEIHQEIVKAAGKDFQEELQEDILSALDNKLVFESGKFWETFTVTARDCVLMALCEHKLHHTRVALNYPITCNKNIPRFRYDHMFCAEENVNLTFTYNNLHFPYSVMRKLLLCDLVIEYV